MKIAALGDIHVGLQNDQSYAEFFSVIGQKCDVLLLCGDLTNTGLPEEAKILVEETRSVSVPVMAVLGNHDYDRNDQKKIIEILSENNITVLDGDFYIINDVAFVGVKGFCGGFDDKMLAAFGEGVIKSFVQETVDESLKLDRALSRVNVSKKIVFSHYSPIKATVVGEPEEIFPFLGCSLLEDAINRRGVLASFHGHAHHGAFEGKTSNEIPVFNVTKQNCVRMFPDDQCFIYEI